MTFRVMIAIACIGIALADAAPVRADSDSVTYTYDAFGRVSVITYANGTTITYNYDLATNRLAQTVVCSSSGC